MEPVEVVIFHDSVLEGQSRAGIGWKINCDIARRKIAKGNAAPAGTRRFLSWMIDQASNEHVRDMRKHGFAISGTSQEDKEVILQYYFTMMTGEKQLPDLRKRFKLF